MSSALGSGIFLDDDFDFEVDETGDIRTTTGVEELQKDIAYGVAYSMQTQLGERVDQVTQKQVNLIVRNILIEEVRVNNINRVDARQLPSFDGYEIVIDADTTAGSFELVFEVNL